MAAPIYLLVLGNGYTEAWYQLSKAEQDSLLEQVQEVDRRAGVIYHLTCKSRWADEALSIWGVGEYPSMEAYQGKVDALEALGWWRYWSGKTILGTKVEVWAE